MTAAAITAVQTDMPAPIGRRAPDFGLNEHDVPRFWFDNDPFKTRLLDALSLTFPLGEQFFINCVRDYKGAITDPVLREQVRDFSFQEGQHGRVHRQYNALIERQGMNVAGMEDAQARYFAALRRRLPRSMTLSFTAAAEHLTAVMAQALLRNPQLFENADPRIRAVYFWHAVEESEHKAVAFDVLTGTAKARYPTRVAGLLFESLMFPLGTVQVMKYLLHKDGVETNRRFWLDGLRWLFGRGGLLHGSVGAYFRYYRPGFHPWQAGVPAPFHQWLAAYERHGGDPVKASNDFVAEARTA